MTVAVVENSDQGGMGCADDVSGIPSAQLAALVEQHLDTDIATFARRVGIDSRYLRRLVFNPVTPVVKLGIADRVLMALDLNMTILESEGLITIVPLRETATAAMRIVDEEIAVAQESGLPAPTEDAVQERIASLLAAYADNCQPTPEQIARRAKDYARKQK